MYSFKLLVREICSKSFCCVVQLAKKRIKTQLAPIPHRVAGVKLQPGLSKNRCFNCFAAYLLISVSVEEDYG